LRIGSPVEELLLARQVVFQPDDLDAQLIAFAFDRFDPSLFPGHGPLG
jgi:hypothetical protein